MAVLNPALPNVGVFQYSSVARFSSRRTPRPLLVWKSSTSGMTSTFYSWPRQCLNKSSFALLLVLHCLTIPAMAQNCYYPDGSIALGMAACDPDSAVSACCPLNWMCLDTKLCSTQDGLLLGRYTCTQQEFTSPDCPLMCLHNGTSTGNEAVLWCGQTKYCCDGDRSFDCCRTAGYEIFSMTRPTPVATISTTMAPTGTSSTAESTTSDESTSTTSSTESTSSTSSAETPFIMSFFSTSRTMTTMTGPNGVVSTVTAFITPPPSDPTPTSTSDANGNSTSSSSSVGKILGPVLGGLAFLILIAGLWYLFRRRRNNKDPSPSTPPSSNPCQYTDMYPTKHDGHPPELDSHPVALGRTTSGHRSELPGSGVPASSQQRRSHATGNTISPLLVQGAPSSDQTPSTGTGVSPIISSRGEQRQSVTEQLWGRSDGQPYQAYKPPPTELPAG